MDLLTQLPSFETHAKLLIAASEASIARIESQIKDLERLRDRERGIVVRLRAAITPVHKLPAELLVEIFRYHSDRFPPTVKTLAITTPRLWTSIPHIAITKTRTDAYVAGLKEWVDRSAPLPIQVCLSCQLGADATAVLGVLLTAAHRWSRATFDLPSLSVLSRVPPDALKHLQNLQLHSQDKNYGTMVAFSLAYNLHTLDLDTRRTSRLRMPWSNLEELEMTADTPQECLDSLLQCTNIVSAQFCMPAWADLPDHSKIKLTTLGRLETLDIMITRDSVYLTRDSVFLTPFFVCLALPALKRLSLGLVDKLGWSSVEFTQFQLRSPNIDYLNISYSNIDSEDLMAILRHAPSLLELHLTSCGYTFDDLIVEALCSSPQGPVPLVPRLHTLEVNGCENLPEDTLDALITSRWWTDEQLLAFPSPPKVSRWLYIAIDRDGDSDTSPEFETKLVEYRAQGLRVEVS
ncbi:hypothetical protein C8F04DRAFT_1064426 [Mycena alexandri]|uniref:F-box domain-containing protein n=1 Tax=Mycena alexandri TaxID=1745969 RepID=A0AAD6XDY8_9AGAR|nr:hypothetical protein C8F04DRAFT_1064426 [Mycena alexandri]